MGLWGRGKPEPAIIKEAAESAFKRQSKAFALNVAGR